MIDPRIYDVLAHMQKPQAGPVSALRQPQQQQGGFRGLMSRPGVGGALQAMGAAMMAQSDSPGQSFLGNLGRSFQPAMQAYGQGKTADQFQNVLSQVKDPSMRSMLELLGPERAIQTMMTRAAPVKVGRDERLVDPDTGKVLIDSEGGFEYMKSGDDIVVLQDGQEFDRITGSADVDFSDVSSLRKEFEGAISEFDKAAEAFVRVQDAGSGEQTAAKDIALIFNFMKTVDPGSTVREGEFATAQNAAGVPERVRNLWNQALDGTRLGDDQRREIVAAAREQIKSQVPIFNARAEFYRGIAGRNDFDFDDVIRDPFSGLDLTPPAAASNDPLGIR